MKVGVQCENCKPNVHSHYDHQFARPQICLIDGCHCRGLKIRDMAPIKDVKGSEKQNARFREHESDVGKVS